MLRTIFHRYQRSNVVHFVLLARKGTKRLKDHFSLAPFLPGFVPFVATLAGNAQSKKTSTPRYFKHVKSQIDLITKSEEDKRSYRGIEMKNGMKVLLVSDPATDKAAASLDVNVGSMNDPPNMLGLAHFCEHMLFLGTEKYPNEREFDEFLAAHAGKSNAYTSFDHTNYYFDVALENLEEALDRLAQFLLCPLFSPDAVEREVNAVDSEHKRNVKSDDWRLPQLVQSLAYPNHDFNKFGTGNRKTLMKDAKAKDLEPREELLKFHHQFYSSNITSICVVGKQSLDELASYVVPLMAEVEDKGVDRPEWLQHPFGNKQLGFRLNVVPVKDLRSLRLLFPIPDLQPQYRTKPGHYISHLLNHQGAGSLLSELKKRGWVNSIAASDLTPARGFGFFIVDFALTEEGLKHWEDIVELLFGYFGFLESCGPQEWIYEECSELEKMRFRFKDKEKPMQYASWLASALHYYPLEEILYGPYMMVEYKPDLIESLMKKLTSRNMGVVIMSQQYKGATTDREGWYGTEYSLEYIQKIVLDRFEKAKVGETMFRLPDKNDFITKNLGIARHEKKLGPVPTNRIACFTQCRN